MHVERPSGQHSTSYSIFLEIDLVFSFLQNILQFADAFTTFVSKRTEINEWFLRSYEG